MAQIATRKKTIAVALAAAIALSLICAGTALAKYIHQETNDTAQASQAFYFESDVLSSDGQAAYSLPAGTTSFAFEVRNYPDDLRFSEGDITYSWSVTRQGDASAVQSGTGTIGGGKKASDTVTAANLTAGTYEVTAKSSAPYEQELSATFTIAPTDTAVYSTVEDKASSATATLVVSTRDYEGNIRVSWPEGVVPDTTQRYFKGVETADAQGSYADGSTDFRVSAHSSYTLRFFKQNPSQDFSSGTQIKAEALK